MGCGSEQMGGKKKLLPTPHRLWLLQAQTLPQVFIFSLGGNWRAGGKALYVGVGARQMEAPPSSLLAGWDHRMGWAARGVTSSVCPEPCPAAVGDVSPGRMEGGVGRKPS